jgi:hypothetical protein
MTLEPERATALPTGQQLSPRRATAEGVACCLLVNVAGSVLFLIGANQVLFSPAMLAVGVLLAAMSAAAGVWLRRGGRQRLGVGVIIGAVAAVPVELMLSCVWAIVVMTFLM